MHHPVFNRAFRLLLLTCVIVSITGCSLFYKKLPPAPEEKPGTALDLVLSSLFLKRQDLGIACPIQQNDPFQLHKVPLLLNSPMQINSFAEYCEAELNKAPRSLSSLIILAADSMELKIRKDSGEVETVPCRECAGLPALLQEAVEDISSSLLSAQALFAESLKELTSEERHFITKRFVELLLPKAPTTRLTRRQEQDLNEKALFLAGRVNRQKMIEAALMVSEAIDRALTILSAENISQLRPEFTREQITINTAAGEIIIGGFGGNRYSGSIPALLIDVGGDDAYSFVDYSPLSVIIDLSGNDSYASAGSATYGAGIMGMGFLVDRAGDDRYSAQNSSFGTGFFGAGVLLDERGDDAYSCQTLAEGAGAFGLGILCDWQGNDLYQSATYSQGFGFTGGCGLLIDYRGADRVISRGGVADFREKSGAYQTCSQGFGQGFRGLAAGGIGILYNGEGDDIYEGSYFCQGSSYWLSIGMLIDNKGNDTYQARRYSEGAGVHSSIGALLDREGNDSYTSWAVSQGCGHDRSIGMLWDIEGNDRYSAEWLSQGSGNDAGRGILIDEQGDDTYAAGTQGTQGCGIFDVRRDEMSIGILVDGSGSDTFKGNGKGNDVWTCGKIGGGIDAEGRMPAVSVTRDSWFGVRETRHGAQDTSDETDNVKEKSAENRQQTTENRQKEWVVVPELEAPLITEDSWEKAAATLAGKSPAIIPAIVQYLGIKDVLVSRTIEETFKKIGQRDVGSVHNLVKQKNLESSKKAFLLYVLGEIASPHSQDLFLELVKNKDAKVQAMALRGLYKLKACPPAKHAKRFSKSENVEVKRYLALSLRYSKDKSAAPLLEKLQNDSDFNVRYSAAETLKK
jgi:hypothetical protein